MSAQARRERGHATRKKLIVTAARELAEAEGWEAVTTRRLAGRIGYSQPVLYGHFKDKNAIVAAVAAEGFNELATELCTTRLQASDADRALADVGATYLAFAARHPALYDAMFASPAVLPAAEPGISAPWHAALSELTEAIRPYADGDELDQMAESFWAAIHGLVMLTRSGWLQHEGHDRRLALLVAQFSV